MSIKFIQTQKAYLDYSIDGNATTIRLKELLKLDGTAMSASDIGDLLYGTFDPGIGGKEEIFSIDGANVTVGSDGKVTVTGVVRGLIGESPYGTGGFSTDHGAGAVVVFGNNPQAFDLMAIKRNANTFTALNTFSGYAPQTDTDPVAGNDLTRLSYVQALVLGTLTTIDVVVPGTAGETIADGNLIYLNTDNKWYKTDADTASTVNNVLLGIAKGAGTLNNAITNGILLQGTDNAQSGLTEGQVQYASNTAGAISNTPGTNEVTVGIAKSATELYFSPRFNQQLTENQQDALAGTVGTPSASNLFVTNDDTSGTGSIVRASLITNFLSNQTYTYGETITAGDTLYYKNSDSKVYKASASTTDEALYNYIGIALESGVLNDVKKVATIDGSVLTGLSLGNQTTAISETAIVTQSSTAGGNIHALYDASPSACGFISGSTQGNVSKITVGFGANTGAGATNVTINLHEVTNYGSNSVTFGTSLGSVTITPTPSATNTFTFASPITIKPNTHYVIVFTATGGGAGNYFALQGSDDSIADTYFYNSGSGVTSPMTITAVGKCFTISVFSTLTFNYDINDYLFLGDTAGSYSFVGGTNKKVIGRILSSSSIVLGLPAMRTLVKQYTSTPYKNSNTSWLLIPVPKNAVALDGMFSVTTTNPTEFIYSFAMDLGKTQTVKCTVSDSTGANAKEMGITATWGRGQVTPFNEVETYAGHTLPINFYR